MSQKLPTRVVHTMPGHEGPIYCAKFNPLGSYALTGGADRCVRLWNPHKGLLIKTYKGHSYDVLDVCVAIDNSRFCSCGGDKISYIWDVTSGRIIRRFRGHASKINAITFNDDESVIATGSYDKSVRMYDCRSNNFDAFEILDDAKDSITSVVIKGHEIFTGSVDGYLRTYDIRYGVLRLDNTLRPITHLSLSHDGNCILVSNLDSTLRLIEKSSGDLLSEYKGHKNDIFRINSTMNDSDSHIISGSEDGNIYYWDLVDCKVVATTSVSPQVTSCVSYHPDECCMVTASFDGVAKFLTAA